MPMDEHVTTKKCTSMLTPDAPFDIDERTSYAALKTDDLNLLFVYKAGSVVVTAIPLEVRHLVYEYYVNNKGFSYMKLTCGNSCRSVFNFLREVDSFEA